MTKPAPDPTRMTPLRLGDWTVEPLRNRMHRGETVVTLEPKVMRLLVCLAARPGQVMTRQDLLAQVWDGLNVVDGAMGRAVYQLRRQLARCEGCGADVETIRQVGYRLVLTRRAPATRVAISSGSREAAWSGPGVSSEGRGIRSP
ncbi:MAG TPA: winged helix-turn-helix domain-containing protein, partial [Brevundimonas sp.]|uniref:winged helix-turn-helix domain-containing protein n=1 Tax=Brevundimonas sp. TaxID=1871086 RepID=UPI00260E5D89